jgi:hypothetical protein
MNIGGAGCDGLSTCGHVLLHWKEQCSFIRYIVLTFLCTTVVYTSKLDIAIHLIIRSRKS